MVSEIYDLKNQALEGMRQTIEQRGGFENANIEEMYKYADIVKDLAQAEKDCWMAEYYRGVSESMEGESGYAGGYGYPGGQNGSQGGSGGSRGGSQGGQQGRSGYRSPGRGSANQYGGRRGYGMGYPIDDIRVMMQNADPQEKERLKQELRTMMSGEM